MNFAKNLSENNTYFVGGVGVKRISTKWSFNANTAVYLVFFKVTPQFCFKSIFNQNNLPHPSFTKLVFGSQREMV